MALKGQTKAKPTLAEPKARQSIKIRKFGAALRRAGINSLDAQARALGLKRSTAWTIPELSDLDGLAGPCFCERGLGLRLAFESHRTLSLLR